MKILKFISQTCIPCKELSKQLSITQLPYPLVEVDGEDCDPELIKKYKIRSVPTLILIDDEENEIWRNTGYITGIRLLEELNKIKTDD